MALLGIRGYTIERRLEGPGGVQLYAGRRDRDNLPIVARVYPKTADSSLIERLEREYRLIGSVRSEGVLRLVDFVESEDVVVLVAESFDGQTLDAYAGPGGATNDVFLPIAVRLARAVADVHESGVIHKDLRPANVLIDPYRLQVRLKGFALSVEVASTHPGEELYQETLPYVSPEQTGRMQRRVDYRSDLYSLGATLYHLATGRPPFVGDDPVELMHAHVAREPEAPDVVKPGFPKMLSGILQRLLQKDPEDRYQSATSLLRDLQRCHERMDERGGVPEFALPDDELARTLEPSSTLYGRSYELKALAEAFGEVRGGGALRLVLVTGLPGVGKSALVEASLRGLEGAGARCVHARLDALTGQVPYAGFRHAFSLVIDQILTSSDEALAVWRRRLNQALSPIAQAVVELVPKLGWVVGPQPPLPELGAVQARRRLIEAFRRLIGVVASTQHPLVLFLDDLQWSDEGTLHLIEGLVASHEPLPMLLIGAYQHREIKPDHALAEVVERMLGQDPSIRSLRVQPLPNRDVNRLVADTLGRDEQETTALTALIARKTDSNPLFVKQFLVYAASLGLLVREPEEGWSWNLHAIEEAGIPDDVAAMMTDKITRLPLRFQRVLKYASVVGMHFDLDTLMALDPAREQLQEHLAALVDEGLLERAGDGYRFSHQRIREAVYGLVPAIEAARLFRLIGRHRIAAIHPDHLPERVFEVVEPLNRALVLLQDDAELLQLVRLDLVAGRRALETGALIAADNYLQVAHGLLRPEHWESHGALCLDVHLASAEAASRLGDTDRAESLYRTMLGASLPDLHRAEVCGRLAGLYVVRGEPERAVKIGTMGLRRLGSALGRSASWLGVAWQGIRAWWTIRGMDEKDWSTLQPSVDPVWRTERFVVEEMAPAAFFTDPKFVARLAFSALRGLPERGYVGHPGVYLAVLAVVVAHGLGRLKRAQRIGQLALELIDRYPDAPGAHKIGHLVHGLVDPWTVQWGRSLSGLERAQELAIEAGDVPVQAYLSGHQATFRFLLGLPLQEVEEYTKTAAAQARKVGFEDIALSIEAIGDASFLLRAMPSDTDVITVMALDRLHDRVGWARFDGYGAAGVCLVVFGRYAEAWRLLSDPAAGVGGGMAFPTVFGAECTVLRAMAGAASAGQEGGPSRRAARGAMRQALRMLRPFVRVNPQMFEARFHLLRAEWERLAGRPLRAQHHYTTARVSIAPMGQLHLYGILLERQASLAAEQRWDIEAQSYTAQARGVWKAWGAQTKVAEIDDPTAGRLHVRHASGSAWTGSAPPGDASLLHPRATLDMATMMDTARALSEEVHLDAVVERVLQGALANAGATRAALLLAEDGSLRLEADLETEGRYRHLRPAVPVEDAAMRLPVAVVRLVARTVETVVVSDAPGDARFGADPYLAAQKVRSVLCLPILKRTKLVGVLYLENTLVAGAFTEERQEMLRLIAAQGAISLENARLVEALRGARDDLEARVEARTGELVALQDGLVSAARRAGMAEVATGVLHNVGNVLNSVNTATADLSETLQRSRLPSLERTVALIEAHRDDLARYLTEDPKGRLVPEFLRVVVRQLLVERERMTGQADALTRNIDHMRQVIASQQAFAGVGGVAAEVDVEALVEEAIRICGATRPWRNHRIVRQFDVVAPLLLERSKVLQILVNLVSNARDALDELPEHDDLRLIISLHEDGSEVQVTVRDFGVGIPADNLPRIFHHGFTTKRNGHGFGLHSSAIAAKQLGGAIRVESDGPGRGAAFTLALPRHNAARAEAS